MRVPTVEAWPEDAEPTFEQEVAFVAIEMLLKPEWWQGPVDEVRFWGTGFELGEPGFWGRYEGTWSLRAPDDPPGSTPRGYASAGTAVRIDDQTGRADRPGHGIVSLWVRTAGRVTVVATSETRLAAATDDDGLGIDDAGVDDFFLCTRTTDLAQRGIDRLVVRAQWARIGAGEGYTMRLWCEGGVAGARSFLDAWPRPERLGTAERLTGVEPGIVDVEMAFSPGASDIVSLVSAWHDLAGFRTFI